MSTRRAVVLFDGVCNLCDGFVQWVIDHDRAAYFCFAALQSEAGLALLAEQGMQPEQQLDSIVVLDQGRLYTHSDAALHVLAHLDRPWPVLSVLVVVPRPVRDVVYRLIARYRYRWFGKRTECRVPTPELKARFLS
jgi:predicted DCC family thiol-disulfide oxidoreductase YuxK